MNPGSRHAQAPVIPGFIRILTGHHFKFISQRGSHAKYRDPHGHTVIVPHPRKDIPVGTLRSMIRQSGLPDELFE